jgi:hypothetical protein
VSGMAASSVSAMISAPRISNSRFNMIRRI